MKWFKHDSNANMDAKLQEILLDYGLEGYGLYWYCIELISAKVDADNLTFELEHDARIIARNTGCTPQKTQEIMKRFVELGLFESSQGVITCLKLSKRTDEYTSKLVRNSRQYQDKLQTVSGQNPKKSLLLDKNRSDQIREEKNREKKSNKFTPPSIQQVSDYCFERGNSVDPQTFIDHYEANGWVRGKSKIKCWKACVRTWEKNSKPDVDTSNQNWTQLIEPNMFDEGHL